MFKDKSENESDEICLVVRWRSGSDTYRLSKGMDAKVTLQGWEDEKVQDEDVTDMK